MASGSKAWQMFGLVSTIGAGVVARRLMHTTWRVATGKQPPQNPEHPDVSLAEAVVWASLSGVAVGLARMLASRRAAEYYRKSTGRLPANLENVKV